ncbi:MAG: hypothetical protein ACR2K1_04115 [Saprospiraceae bacterium]
MIPVVATLLKNGLSLLGNAVLAKGQDWVEKKTGVKLAPDMTPEQLAALKQAELAHEEELLKIQLENSKLAYADTADARSREVKIATAPEAPLLTKIITPALALIVILLTFSLFAVVMFNQSPVEPSRKDVLIYVLGVLSAVSTQVASYYFGSSASSSIKNEMLRDALK